VNFPRLQPIGITLLLILLGAYLGISFNGIQETRDAEIVESVQVSMQKAVSKGMTLIQLPPAQIQTDNFINEAQSSFPKGVTMDKHLHLLITQSHREAQFQVTEKGDMLLVSLGNFTRFHVENGRIVRNAHWVLHLPFGKDWDS
jgi:hypothetical protein